MEAGLFYLSIYASLPLSEAGIYPRPRFASVDLRVWPTIALDQQSWSIESSAYPSPIMGVL